MIDEWIPVNLAARMLGISGPAIRKWIAQGMLEVRVQTEDTPRHGNEYRFIQHVSRQELTRLHKRLSRARTARAK
jgi:hypothetical protein